MTDQADDKTQNQKYTEASRYEHHSKINDFNNGYNDGNTADPDPVPVCLPALIGIEYGKTTDRNYS